MIDEKNNRIRLVKLDENIEKKFSDEVKAIRAFHFKMEEIEDGR